MNTNGAKPRILVVEDEQSLRETLTYNLKREGYDVLAAEDGLAGLGLARSMQPDLVVLDIMLPGMDGLEVCRILRQEMNVPILMLTARTEEIDRVVGLEVGADDYVTKPFGMRELLARIRALLRRVRMLSQGAEPDEAADVTRQKALVFGDLTIDLDRRQASLRGEPLALKPKEYDLLLFLARNRGMVLSRDLILERVWDWSYSGGSRTVDVHVRWLREKIEADPSNPTRILTVRGAGYRFEG
jgi:DNA-binding response OmpR family regulator